MYVCAGIIKPKWWMMFSLGGEREVSWKLKLDTSALLVIFNLFNNFWTNMQNVKIWLNWVFTWVFMLCSKQYISKIFYVKSLRPSSKTALFGFIHVDRILQIFYRSLLFSLPNLLGEMGVGMWEFRYEKCSTSDTFQSRSSQRALH